MSQLIQDALLPLIATVATAIITFLATRKKQAIDLEGGQIDNAKRILEMSEDLTERMQNQLNKSDEIILGLKSTVISLQTENHAHKEVISNLMSDIKKYEQLTLEQKEELEELREDNETLRVLLTQPKIAENEN